MRRDIELVIAAVALAVIGVNDVLDALLALTEGRWGAAIYNAAAGAGLIFLAKRVWEESA